MRFQRSDLPGILIAAVAPVLLTVLFLQAYELWDHHGTPLLGAFAVNAAVIVGLLAAFTRFVRRWEVPIALTVILALLVAGVIALQQTGNDGTPLATGLKWAAVVDFLLLATVIGYQVLTNGLLPVLDRRDARRAQGGTD